MLGREPIPKQGDTQALTILLNRMNAEMKRIGNIRACPPLNVACNSGGIVLSLRGDAGGYTWTNTGGEECPAYGIIKLNGVTGTNNEVLDGSKPDTTFTRLYAVNGSKAVAASSYGICYIEGLQKVLYDSTGTPANGESWGVKPGEWAAYKWYPGWTCYGIQDGNEHLATCYIDPINTLLGKADGTIAKGASATISLYTGNTTPADMTINLTAYDYLLTTGNTVAANKKVIVQWIGGTWWVTAGECS